MRCTMGFIFDRFSFQTFLAPPKTGPWAQAGRGALPSAQAMFARPAFLPWARAGLPSSRAAGRVPYSGTTFRYQSVFIIPTRDGLSTQNPLQKPPIFRGFLCPKHKTFRHAAYCRRRNTFCFTMRNAGGRCWVAARPPKADKRPIQGDPVPLDPHPAAQKFCAAVCSIGVGRPAS